MNRREPTVSITVRFPKALAGRLGERAKQDHQSVSTLLRRYAELGLNGEDYARQTDPIRDIICEEITHSVRQQTDRIAAMLNRLTILSASAYYANLAFVTAFVDQDRYTSFEKIERILPHSINGCCKTWDLINSQNRCLRNRFLETCSLTCNGNSVWITSSGTS